VREREKKEIEIERWRSSDGEMERWRDGEIERWRDGEDGQQKKKKETALFCSPSCHTQAPPPCTSFESDNVLIFLSLAADNSSLLLSTPH
jgi:hypothetical protein